MKKHLIFDKLNMFIEEKKTTIIYTNKNHAQFVTVGMIFFGER